MLLGRQEGIRGKFLLSSFRNASLAKFAKRRGWHTVEIRMASPMTNNNGKGVCKPKIEVLTANYPIAAKGK